MITRHALMKTATGILLIGLVAMQTACNHLSAPNTVADENQHVKIVAAGLLRGDGAHSGPVHNGLKIQSINNGELIITFNDYRMPDDQLQYVVKVTPVNSTTRASLLSVYFVEYIPEGIRLNVRRGNANLSAADLRAAQFMIEVSSIQ